MAHNILIIGNGFDLYHKLPTRYDDFMLFCNEWESFYTEYEKNFGETGDQKPISVPLTERGRLTREALIEFGRHPYLMNQTHIDILKTTIPSNSWIHYFNELKRTGMKWIDFEEEIQNALNDVEEYSMVSIPHNVGKLGKEGLPDRLKRIPDIFGSAADNGYVNLGDVVVFGEFADKGVLQKNKRLLIDFMDDEMEKLISCLQYYFDDFVSSIKCDCYSEQIKAIGKVDVLNFNYTTTYQTIYGGRSLNQHHAVHGGIKNGDIVLGIADDVFPDSYDYIRFQKYFQRIQKRTGNYYRDWIKKEADQEGFFRNKEVWILGHSLGLADFGVLRVFFENECFARVTIFFHSQRSYESIVINLVKALGKDEVIERIATGKIVFQKLKDPILLKTSTTLGSSTKSMNEILRNDTVCL